jgi:hypothetical protein
MGSWPITSQNIWTADENDTTPGERQGVSPPCKYRCNINAHFQNTHHALPDRRARRDQKIDPLQQKSLSDCGLLDITWHRSTSKYAIKSANTAIQ